MAFFDRLNDFAKNLGDKTNDAIETTKLTGRINTERNAAGAELKKIGEYYYALYEGGAEVPAEVLEFYNAAKAHLAEAAAAQAEIDRIKAENEAAKAAAAAAAQAAAAPVAAPVAAPAQPAAPGVVCPACGAANAAGVKFCRECGQKMELPAPEPEVPAQPEQKTCPACGTAMDLSVRFCPECGQKME